MDIEKMTEFLKVLATLPDNEQEKSPCLCAGSQRGNGGKVSQQRKGECLIKSSATRMPMQKKMGRTCALVVTILNRFLLQNPFD